MHHGWRAIRIQGKVSQYPNDATGDGVNKQLSRMVARHEKLKQGRLRALEGENADLKARIAILERDGVAPR